MNIRSIGTDTVTLIIGTLVANLIPVMLQFYLKRVFSPSDFGTFDVYLKVFGILVALSALKYESAILLAKKESDSKHVMYLSILLSIATFVLCIFLILILEEPILLHIPQLNSTALWLLPFSAMTYSIFNITNLFLIRKRKFMLSSSTKVMRRLVEGVTQSGFGSLGKPTGLIWGDVIGNISQAIFSFWKVSNLTTFKTISLLKLKKVAKEFIELPKFTLVPNILNTFVLGSLTFLILDKYSIQEVGYLEFTQKILAIPSVFISVAISQVIFQRVSLMVIKRQKILPFILSVITLQVLFAIILIVMIHFFAQDLFIFIGGEQWDKSGEYAKILVYGTSVMLIFSPLGKVLIALKEFKMNSFWEFSKFIIIASFFFMNDIPITTYLVRYTIAISLFYLVYGFLIIYASSKYQRQLI
jgi:O-antigen/teichoic acid export membrane protein